MGEATYYAKIKFSSKEACATAAPEILGFFLQMQAASDHLDSRRNKPIEWNYWAKFESKFPVVSDYLKMLGNDYRDFPIFGGDTSNLSGLLDIACDEEDVLHGWDVGETIILYYATVWHFADWDGIADFVKCTWGANMTWISDEYIEPFDLI